MFRRTDAASIHASSVRRGILLIGTLAVGIFLSACGDEAENAAQAVLRAENYLADGDERAAVIELKNALQRDPNNGKARLLLGQINLMAGDGAAAESELVKAQAVGMSGIELELALARARLLVGSYQTVLDQVSADISLDNTKARELYVARGEALIGMQRIDEAAALFERVLGQENIARAHGGLARIAILRQQFETAEQHLKEALDLEPETSEWHALEGEALLAQDRYQDALAALEYFAEKDKSHADGQIAYVRALLAVGEIEKARARVTDLQRMAPSDLRLIMLSGIIDLEKGDFLNAKKAAETVLGRNEDNERALYVAGVAAYRLGDYEAANKHLTRYSRGGEKKDIRPLFYLSATKLRLGYADEALALLQSNPDLVKQSTAAMDLLAHAAVRSGDLDTGIEYLEQLAKRNPNDAQTQARLGLVRVAAGEEDAGIDALEKAVEQDPKLDAVAQQLVLQLLRAGKLDDALVAAQKLTEKNPDRPMGYILQGMVALQKGGVSAADPFFRKAWEVEPGNVSAGLNLAQIELNNGNNAAAISILNQVLERHPGHLQALLLLADIEGRSGNSDRQEKLLRDAIEASPDSTQTRVLLARHLLQRNRTGEVLPILRPSIGPDLKSNNVNAALLETAAIAAMMQNDPSQALGYLQQLRKMQPKSVQAEFLTAQAHAALGEPKPAEAALRRALAIDGDHYDSLKMLAAVLQQGGQYEQSLEQLAVAKKLRPTDPSIADLEVRAHLATGRTAEAISAAKQALELAPRTERVAALAQAYWTAGQKAEAIASLDEWLKARPDDGPAHLALASQLLQNGQTDLGLQHYDTAAKLQPNSAVVANDYAWALWLSGKKDQALTEGERALALAPNDPRIKDTLGTILIEKGSQDRAVQLLQAAATALPEDPTIQYHLALALERTGETDRARELLKGVLDGGKNFAERSEAQRLLDSLSR